MGTILAVTGVAALMVPACGGKGGAGSQPLVVVQAAYSKTVGSKSARVSMTSTVTAKSGVPDVTTETGVVDFVNRRAALTLTSRGISTEKRILGSVAYVKDPSLEPKPWIKIDAEKLGPAASAQLMLLVEASDPAGGLDFLKGVSTDVTKLGTEDVRQTTTRHFQASVDLQKVLPQPGAAAAQLAQQVRPVVDVWVDDSGQVRRLRYETAAEPKQVIVEEFYDFGVSVDVTAPAADQVTQFPSGG